MLQKRALPFCNSAAETETESYSMFKNWWTCHWIFRLTVNEWMERSVSLHRLIDAVCLFASWSWATTYLHILVKNDFADIEGSKCVNLHDGLKGIERQSLQWTKKITSRTWIKTEIHHLNCQKYWDLTGIHSTLRGWLVVLSFRYGRHKQETPWSKSFQKYCPQAVKFPSRVCEECRQLVFFIGD